MNYVEGERKRGEVVQKQVKKPGLRGKIDGFCAHCIYDPFSEGSWKQQIRECSSDSCPLYSVRIQ